MVIREDNFVELCQSWTQLVSNAVKIEILGKPIPARQLPLSKACQNNPGHYCSLKRLFR